MIRKAWSISRRSIGTVSGRILSSRAQAACSRAVVGVRKNGGLRSIVKSSFATSTSPRSFLASRNSSEETIYALSTASGRAGIAIIRISGPGCLEIYQALCPHIPNPKPRYATLRSLHDPAESSNVLDSDALILYFPAPKTVTGEDVLELHIHGGTATVKAVLEGVSRVSSGQHIRYAEPGEFTRRAFQNDRLDLAQVEALSDTLSAETEQQRRAAIRGNSGKLGRTYETWRHDLLYARGELEALIDFSEDQYFDETPGEMLGSVAKQVDAILKSIEQHEVASHRGELLKRGIRISLLGAPNAGKSSLLNQVVGREASIVSAEAGTTRDIVEVSLDLKGYLCTFADTAGLRGSSRHESSSGISEVIGAIEQEGIRRAKAKASESDVVIVMASIEPVAVGRGSWTIHCDPEALDIARQAPHSLVVVNKCDLVTPAQLDSLLAEFQTVIGQGPLDDVNLILMTCRPPELVVDSVGGDDISRFVSRLVELFENMTSLPTDMEDLLGVTERQRQLLAACSDHLHDFIGESKMQSSDGESDIVVAAEHLRYAANCLGRITGRGEAGDVEEVLGVVFEKFCVGK